MTSEMVILNSIREAVGSREEILVNELIDQVFEIGNDIQRCKVLNELLIQPEHYRHQEIAMALQVISSETSIPYVEQALEMGFDHLEYTASEDRAIAKWYSHLLGAIGTDEAFRLIRRYTRSINSSVSDEMSYRLKQIKLG